MGNTTEQQWLRTCTAKFWSFHGGKTKSTNNNATGQSSALRVARVFDVKESHLFCQLELIAKEAENNGKRKKESQSRKMVNV